MTDPKANQDRADPGGALIDLNGTYYLVNEGLGPNFEPSPSALERTPLCSLCGKPGRFKADGKGALAGKHRRCRARVTYRPSLWRRLVRALSF